MPAGAGNDVAGPPRPHALPTDRQYDSADLLIEADLGELVACPRDVFCEPQGQRVLLHIVQDFLANVSSIEPTVVDSIWFWRPDIMIDSVRAYAGDSVPRIILLGSVELPGETSICGLAGDVAVAWEGRDNSAGECEFFLVNPDDATTLIPGSCLLDAAELWTTGILTVTQARTRVTSMTGCVVDRAGVEARIAAAVQANPNRPHLRHSASQPGHEPIDRGEFYCMNRTPPVAPSPAADGGPGDGGP